MSDDGSSCGRVFSAGCFVKAPVSIGPGCGMSFAFKNFEQVAQSLRAPAVDKILIDTSCSMSYDKKKKLIVVHPQLDASSFSKGL
ncbi:unnamed protein product [Larinioides sclopetarius]|uniref:Uncharacterized protein n=1 Tax=Larinioides sclopetarius TaxID=280406 RepID=A0AAV2BD87_9ARAC